MFFTLLNSAMHLNSWCTLEAMFRFLTFPPFCYVKIRKKDDFAIILTAWFYLIFAKEFNILVRKYVDFMYQVSNISKLLTLISFRTDNFGGKNLKFYHFQDGGLYSTEFVQINTKINHYPVILFQHNKYEIYLPTYSLIFRKNFLHLNEFTMDHRYEQPFLKMAAERYLPDSRVGNHIGKKDKKPVPSNIRPCVLLPFLLVMRYTWFCSY